MTLQEFQTRQNLSLTALAALLGRPISTVHGWVSGARRPDWDGLALIQQKTEGKVTPSDFMPPAKAA